MIQFDVQSDASQFHDALVSFIKEKQVPVADALRFQGRLLGKRLIEFTPPQTRAQGKLAVERDIRRWLKGTNLKSVANSADIYLSQNLYPTRGKTKGEQVAARRAVKAVRQRVQGRDVVRVFATKDGRVYGIDLERFWPNRSMEDFAAIHRANRDARGRGRTLKNPGSLGTAIGRWTFLNNVITTHDKVREYIRSRQANVGMAKGGWAAGFMALGGKPPDWVAKHANQGDLVDHSKDPVAPYIRFRNHSPWTNRNDDERIIQNALDSRARDIGTDLLRASTNSLRRLLKS